MPTHEPHCLQPTRAVAHLTTHEDGRDGSDCTELRSFLTDLSPTMRLYDRLVASRLRLPGIVSPATDVVCMSGPDTKTKLYVHRATTTIFGDVEIKTTNDLTAMNDLHLVHPWICPLFDQEFSRATAGLDKTGTRTPVSRSSQAAIWGAFVQSSCSASNISASQQTA